MQKTSANSTLTQGVIWRQILSFFWPIVVGTFFQQLYNTADAVIVGKSVGKEALAAVGGTTGTLINLLLGFFIGLSSGATVVISQYYGAENEKGVSSAVHTAAALCLLSGFLLSVCGVMFAPWLLSLMSTPSDVLPHALPYLRIVFAGMIPVMVYNIGTGFLRAVGDSRNPLLILMVACFANIALDLLLIVGFGMGTRGAAAATVLAQSVSAILVVHMLFERKDGLRLYPSRIRFESRTLRSILRIGLPAGLQSVMYSLSNAMIQAAVNGFSTDILAGWTAYGKIDGLYWMIVSAFGISITTFVGQNWGAGQIPRARRAIRECLAMTFGLTVLLVFFLLYRGELLLRLFTDSEDVIKQGMHIIRRMAPFFVAYIPIEILSGAMRGAGDSAAPTLMILVGVCLFRVIWVLLLAPVYHSFDLVIASYPVTWIFTGMLFVFYYYFCSPFRRRKKAHGIS